MILSLFFGLKVIREVFREEFLRVIMKNCIMNFTK